MANKIIDTTSVPTALTITNETSEVISLPLFPDNGTLELQPDDQIVYKVGSAREYVYYYTTCRDLGLSLAE